MPTRRIESLKPIEIKRLHKGIIEALKQGIKNRGTSTSDYRDATGRKGFNQEKLFVYARGKKPCRICRITLIKARIAGRGTVYCPSCQK